MVVQDALTSRGEHADSRQLRTGPGFAQHFKAKFGWVALTLRVVRKYAHEQLPRDRIDYEAVEDRAAADRVASDPKLAPSEPWLRQVGKRRQTPSIEFIARDTARTRAVNSR